MRELAWAVAIVLTVSSGSLWTSAQYETANYLCGGFFRFIKGSIDFTFNSSNYDVSDVEKICMWTVSPTRQYRNFSITAFQIPDLSCTEYSLTITTFTEWEEEPHYSVQFCGAEPIPTLPFQIEGTVMVIILKARKPSTLPINNRFRISYDRLSEDDAIDRVRLIQTSYSWARPSLDPLPYDGAYFLSNSLSTFGYVKANYSDALSYLLRFNFLTIKIEQHDESCVNTDFLLMTEIQSDGRLANLQVYKNNVTDTPVIGSPYGYFIIYWGGICGVGAGGGSMMYFYETVRIA